MASMVDRVIRAVKLDKDFYNEAERDTSLNQEALLVVIIVSLASGLGSLIGGFINRDIGFGGALLGAVITIVLGIASYYIWAYVTLFVGTKFFGGTADAGEMLRTLGYAQAPRLLGLLSFIPCVGPIISLLSFVLSLVAVVVAIREALDFDTGKAIVTAIIGWVIIMVITMIIGAVIGIGGLGVAGIMSALQG